MLENKNTENWLSKIKRYALDKAIMVAKKIDPEFIFETEMTDNPLIRLDVLDSKFKFYTPKMNTLYNAFRVLCPNSEDTFKSSQDVGMHVHQIIITNMNGEYLIKYVDNESSLTGGEDSSFQFILSDGILPAVFNRHISEVYTCLISTFKNTKNSTKFRFNQKSYTRGKSENWLKDLTNDSKIVAMLDIFYTDYHKNS